MATSAEQINDLIGGYTDLKQYFEGIRAAIDGKLADLPALVLEMGAYQATWDPNEANPTNERDGVFSDLEALINSAPRGSTVYVFVPAGAVVDFPEQRIYVNSRYVRISSDAANPATINFPAYLNELGNNARFRFHVLNAGEIAFQDINLIMAPKVDVAKSWHVSQAAIIASSYGHKVRLRMDSVHVVGTEDAFVVTGTTGCLVEASLTDVELSGTMRFLHNAEDGVALLSVDALTLTGGAVLQVGGTLVTGTILTN